MEPDGPLIPRLLAVAALRSEPGSASVDVVLRNGIVCDGTGSPCTPGRVAVIGDKIVKTGDVSATHGRIDIADDVTSCVERGLPLLAGR